MGLVRTLIPSMFQRRLLLLAVFVLAGFGLLSVRLAWVTVAKGDGARAVAEKRLVRETWLPTVRGRILDRQGRVLAQDRPSYDLCVSYEVMTGAWAQQAAERFARAANRDVWGTLDDAGRAGLVERYRPAYERRVEQMWTLLAEGSGVGRAEIDAAVADMRRRVEAMQAEVTRARAASEKRKLEEAGIRVGPAEEARIARIAASPIAEVLQKHPVVRGVADDVGFRFMRLAERDAPMFSAAEAGEAALEERQPMLPGLEVVDATARVYPFDTVRVEIDRATLPSPIRGEGAMEVEVTELGSLVLGSVRRSVYAEDIARRAKAFVENPDLRSRAIMGDGLDTGRYFNGDRVGHTGIEAAYEDELRGLRGLKTENLQTRAVEERAPIPGLDVHLTVDIQLQARVSAVLDPSVGLTRVQGWHHNEKLPLGTDLDAAVVVLDVGTGEVLAMASTPVMPRDGDWSARGLSGEALERYKAVHAPHINRAVGKPYQPGSIVKAMILCGAIKAGEYTPGQRLPDIGHYFPNRPTIFRSWIFKDYGITHADQLGRDPDDVDALMVSSNVFFFTLGDRLGTGGVASVYRMFGVGDGFDLGVGGEWPGSIGGLSNGVNDGSDMTREDAILLGIGQGPITWTPLHAADAYATIARGGVRIVPRLVSVQGAAPRVKDLGIPAVAVRRALEGLWASANDAKFGTGVEFAVENGRDRIFNAPGVSVWGKTGTADSSPVVYDPDGDGPLAAEVARDGDHSWYVALVGDEGGPPRYSIAVVVDYGGSGGRVSGPIANQVVHALIQEGYLGFGRPKAGLP